MIGKTNIVGSIEPGSRTLRTGASGSDVEFVQEALGVAVDGEYGPNTGRAVSDFQLRNELKVDGVVGSDTWKLLLEPDLSQEDNRESPPNPHDVVESESDLNPAFTAEQAILTSVESPGGGRITDKTDPKPSDVVEVPGYGGKSVPLHRLAASAWIALMQAARTDGIEPPSLLPVSGYRSFARQQALWQHAIAKHGSEEAARQWVAPPGQSAHQSGRAVDCHLDSEVDSRNAPAQRQTQSWSWLFQNAERFGFYPYAVEPWHWEYNPPSRSMSDN